MEPPFSPLPHRVLMTADTLGGVWTYALELVKALAPYDIHFTIAAMGSWMNPEQIRQATALPNLEVCESDFKLEWMTSPWREVARAGDWLMGLAAERRPELIHLNGYAHGALSWPSPVLVVAHSCVFSWWRAVKGEDAPEGCKTYREVVSRGIHAANLVVAPSRAMLEAARYFYGPFAASEVIYNARELQDYQPATKKNLVLTAGRFWDEAKNMAALTAVAPELPWPVHVAGETKSPDGKQYSPEHALPLGRLSARELTPWLAQASIYAMPALYEPFGISVLEAALAKCALVLGDIPSLREIWDDAAVFVPPRDHAALKAALLELINNDVRRTEMATRAHARAQEFNPRRMAEGYLSAYARLMKSAAKKQQENQELVACES